MIDGGDLPIVNQIALKIYEVSKFCSMTFHNYGPTLNTMNLAVWEGLERAAQEADASTPAASSPGEVPPAHRIGRQAAAAAKAALEPKGMTVVQGNVEAFRKVAQEKIWPAYKQQYAGLWEQIVEFKA